MIRWPRRVAWWGLRASLRLHHWSYNQANAFALRYYGVHPKHRLTGIHQFFLERIEPGDAVLDIGCGQGVIAASLATKAGTVVAFDQSPAAIRDAIRLRSQPHVTYYVGEATRDLPKDRRFDVAVSSGVLEHLENRAEHLQAVAGLARRLLMRLPNLRRSWTVLLCQELGLPFACDPDHKCEYTVESARQELEENGWRVELIDTSEGEIRLAARSLRFDAPAAADSARGFASSELPEAA